MTLFPRREPKRAAPPSAEPKQPTVVDMETVLEQWQNYLDTGTVSTNDNDKKDGSATTARRARLPYHAQRPLRHACLCRLGTCRYDKLPAAYKERLHADFGRLEPSRQLRELLGRMYTEGKAKRERKQLRSQLRKQLSAASAAAAAARKGRCKWVYWLPALGAGQVRRKVCKAAFMAVHGITEKRTRDVQLLWMRLKAKRGSTPTGDESDIEQEELMPGAYTDVEDDEDEGKTTADVPVKPKAKPKPPRQPYRGRKVLKTSSDSEESSSSESEGSGSSNKKEVPVEEKVMGGEETSKEAKDDVKSKASQNGEETEVEGDDEAEDDEDVPYVDITGFEPICSLEEDSRNLVLSLPRGVFGEDGDDAAAEET